MSQVDRVLALLRSRGPQGLNTASLQELPTLDGGKPVLRLAARIQQLKDRGYSISSQRQPNGTAQYVLVGEPERALSDANDPTRREQADPGSVPYPAAKKLREGVRSAAPAEAHLFDTSTFTERRSYEDEAA